MPDFFDITEPDRFLPEPTTPWWLWVLGGLASLLVIALAYYLYQRKSTTRHLATLLDKARLQLEKLRKDAPSLPPHVLATRLSLIIRRYLASAFDEPALFETNEEFTLRKSALNQLHPDSRQPVTQFLTELSQLKYAPERATPSHDLINEAEDLLANIEINVNDPDDEEPITARPTEQPPPPSTPPPPDSPQAPPQTTP